MRKLGRRKEHRESMLINLAKSLLEHGKIETTVMRAKELRPFVEKLITRGKVNDLHTKRTLLSKLQNCFTSVLRVLDWGLKNKEIPGGYTRIIRSGFRTNFEPKAIIEIIHR